MLKILEKSLRIQKLPYFWNKSLNLYEKMSDIEMKNCSNRLRNILNEMEKINTQPLIIAKYICK